MKLGKKTARRDPRNLRLVRYLNAQLPPSPPSVDFAQRLPNANWQMLANDRLGDCTCAAAGHMIQEWTGGAVMPAEDAIVAAYSAITGYTAGDAYSDQGAAELDVLNFWRSNGIAGHRILAYMALEPTNVEHVKVAVWLFQGCYIGLQLPLSAQDQDIWDVEPLADETTRFGSWGGHAVNVVGYDEAGITVITWGRVQRMTWRFWAAYCDEAYAVLSPDMIPGEGLDLDALRRDLALVGGATFTPTPVAPTGRKIYCGIFTGLWTALQETPGSDCGLFDLQEAVLVEMAAAGDRVKRAVHGWNGSEFGLFVSVDAAFRKILDEIEAFGPDEIYFFGHSFGGADLIAFVAWLRKYYPGRLKVKLAVLMDEVTNPGRFGSESAAGWQLPAEIVETGLCYYQTNGIVALIVGTPVAARPGVMVVDVTGLRFPQLGHVDFFWLVCLIRDARVRAHVIACARALRAGLPLPMWPQESTTEGTTAAKAALDGIAPAPPAPPA